MLDKAEGAARSDSVTIGQILRKVGSHSFPAVILLVAMIAATPLSGIPGVSIVAALIIGLMLVQMAWGAEEIWLPNWVRRQSIGTKRLSQAIGYLRGPIGKVEPLLKPRLVALTRGPGRIIPMAASFVIVLVLPILDFIPLTGSAAALILVLFAAGLLVRDGALVLLALILLAVAVGTVVLLI